ncbi:MAG: aminotransferase class V-fold PLP-dependent enzyme [Oscillospiraceae bacterium]
MIYLDSAATTLQKPPAVAAAVGRAMATMARPGRGGHQPAMLAAETVFHCRELAAELFDVGEPERVVFTCNATHGLNIAIHSLVKPGGTALISGYEHNAVTRTLKNIDGLTLKVADAPLFRPVELLEQFEKLLTAEVDAVICTHVSNVFGYELPVEELAELCARREKPLIIDASQSAGSHPIFLDRWGAAFIAMPGHKGLYGPQGTGILLCGKDVPTSPVLCGGTGSASALWQMPDFLPDRLEAGTHNVCGIAGLAQGLNFVKRRGSGCILSHEKKLIDQLAWGLKNSPDVQQFYSPKCLNQSGVLSFRTAKMDCEELAELLGKHGIAVRAGLHCAPLAHNVAGTAATGTVRASVSTFNHAQEIDQFLVHLSQILSKKP